MTEKPDSVQEMDPSFKPLMKSYALELLIYIPLVTLYFVIIIRIAKEPFVRLYNEDPVLYAVLGSVLLIGQAVLLEALTSWLLRRIGLRN